jgi:hypothetical protein
MLSRARSFSLVLAAAAVIGTSAVGAPAQQRPIEDFVTAQGTFGGPFAFLVWTDPEATLSTVVDYAGLVDSVITAASGGEVTMGTEFSGGVTERALPDGRAHVHVRLRTTNAFTLGIDFSQMFPDGLIFGNDIPEVLMGDEPGLGDSLLHVKFTNTAPGAPLPDLLQLLLAPEPGQELLYIQFIANAEGPLEDGTPGCLHTTQLEPIVQDGDLENGVVAEFINIGPCDE